MTTYGDDMQQRTDADLVMLACSGNQEASNELVRRYQTKARYIALKIVKQEELAYEITQEAFLAAYLSLDQLRDPERFGGWLTSIVRNFAFSVLKEQQSRPISLEQILEEQPATAAEHFPHSGRDPHELAEDHALQRLLLATIATLTEKERNAVLLYYYQQHSIQEIATLLETSENAVKSRLFKARRALRSQLASEYETASASPTTSSKKGKHTVAEEQAAYQSGAITVPLKYSQATTRILIIAYNEARGLDQPYIGTEHLLLALFHEEAGEVAQLLAQSGLNLEQARTAVRIVSPHVPGEIARGMAQDALRTLHGSMKLTHYFQGQEQTPPYLLLSLLLQEQSLAYLTLQQAEAQPEQIRDQVLHHILGEERAKNSTLAELQKVLVEEEPLVQGDKPVDTPREQGIQIDVDKALQSLQETQQKLLQKYHKDDPEYALITQAFEHSRRRLELTKRPGTTPKARISTSYTDVLMHANAARLRFGHTHHGPEHLLLGILKLNSQQARVAQVLEHLQVERQKILVELEHLLATGNYDVPGLHRMQGMSTPPTEDAIDYAYEEAYQMGNNFIGAEHLLLGLLHLQDNPGVNLLQETGLDAEKIRNELVRFPAPIL